MRISMVSDYFINT